MNLISNSSSSLPKGFVAGNHFDKYGSKNLIIKWMMRGFLSSFDRFVKNTGAKDAFEVGCGEGHLLSRMAATGISVHGCDISSDIVKSARQRLKNEGYQTNISCQSAVAIDTTKHSAELVVCCEVLEHVDDPDAVLSVLTKIATEHLIVSVPREPLWRALNILRGRYLSDYGNTPGHIQHWSRKNFLNLLKNYVDVIDVAAPLPWTMALCRIRTSGKP